MLLYWGMFSVGFIIGAVISFITFAPKKPQDDPDFEMPMDYLAQDQSITALNQSNNSTITQLPASPIIAVRQSAHPQLSN